MMVAMTTMIVSSRFLLFAAMETRKPLTRGRYSAMAVRVGRWYRVASWGLVTVLMLSTTIQISIYVFTEIF